MITIPLSAALMAYLAMVFVFLLFFIVNVYHLAKNASLTLISFSMTLFVSAAAAFVFFGTWTFLREVDWTAPILSLNARI